MPIMNSAKMGSIPANVPVNSGSLPLTAPLLSAIAEALSGIRFGTVTVIIQDGRVVQIDRTERKRMKTGSEK